MIACYQLKAQDTTQNKRDLELQQLLGMSKTEYKTFQQGLKPHDRHLSAVLKDETLNKEARSTELKRVLDERKAYLQQQLTETQQKKLLEYDRQHAPASQYQKQRQELEERLKKKGITVVQPQGN